MVEPVLSGSSASDIQKAYELFKPQFKGATEDEVVTCFSPEPSPYLHIGHVRSAMLNYHFAKMYKGKLILRFDDTAPTNENIGYDQGFSEDLTMLGIVPDAVSYSSDYFDKLEELMTRAIAEGKAYCDDSSAEVLRKERMEQKDSKHRNKTPDENLQIWAQMREGTAKEWYVRGKINMSSMNPAMRDPVFYRCSDKLHHRVGTKYKVYPAYDWVSPIVESLEGVTHSFKTLEHQIREELHEWILDALKLPKPTVVLFTRFSMDYTTLSKRRLIWFMDKGKVQGWDDPRLPTIKGLTRRGITKEALTVFMLEQAPSPSMASQNWDKLWTINKKYIDPQAGRYFTISKERVCTLKITNQEFELDPLTVSLHPKNPELGNKALPRSNTLYLEYEDAKNIVVNEKITLMKWGNCIIKKKCEDGERFYIEGELDENDKDFTTTKKLSWLPQNSLVNLHLHEYDHLLKVAKTDVIDDFESAVNEKTEVVTQVYGEANLNALSERAIIHLERRGYFIIDRIKKISGYDQEMHLIYIPEGKNSA